MVDNDLNTSLVTGVSTLIKNVHHNCKSKASLESVIVILAKCNIGSRQTSLVIIIVIPNGNCSRSSRQKLKSFVKIFAQLYFNILRSVLSELSTIPGTKLTL